MKVKFKKLHNLAVIPSIALSGDVGLDLTITEISETNEFIEYRFGIAVEIPEGYFAMLAPRSSVTKMNLQMANSVGIIDSDFRGQLVCRMRKVAFVDGTVQKLYKVGERAAQLIILPYPKIEVVEATELSDSERGYNGFGSTGLVNQTLELEAGYGLKRGKENYY